VRFTKACLKTNEEKKLPVLPSQRRYNELVGNNWLFDTKDIWSHNTVTGSLNFNGNVYACVKVKITLYV
jgi:hypothetical protein